MKFRFLSIVIICLCLKQIAYASNAHCNIILPRTGELIGFAANATMSVITTEDLINNTSTKTGFFISFTDLVFDKLAPPSPLLNQDSKYSFVLSTQAGVDIEPINSDQAGFVSFDELFNNAGNSFQVMGDSESTLFSLRTDVANKASVIYDEANYILAASSVFAPLDKQGFKIIRSSIGSFNFSNITRSNNQLVSLSGTFDISSDHLRFYEIKTNNMIAKSEIERKKLFNQLINGVTDISSNSSNQEKRQLSKLSSIATTGRVFCSLDTVPFAPQ
jgi:hypothetical protein